MYFDMNVYDFDKTIYDGDSTIDFYLFCVKRKPSILLLLPVQLGGAILYILKIKKKEYFKEKFYLFVKSFNNLEVVVKQFWKENEKKICQWYLKQKKNTDVIVSASPDFLLGPLKTILNIECIIASKVDPKTGKLLSTNCYGKEKIIRFRDKYPKKQIQKFYSDSFSDKPLASLAKHSYLVNNKKHVILPLKDK